MRCALCYRAPCASTCFQLRHPAELQMPKTTKTCPIPSTSLIPPHDRLHPGVTHGGRGAYPPGDLHPWDHIQAARAGARACQHGLQSKLEDPNWEERGAGGPYLYPCKALPPLPARLRRLQPLPRSKRSRWHAQHLRLRFPAAIAELLLSRAEAGGRRLFFFFLIYFPWEF